jgi:hypothetical protein
MLLLLLACAPKHGAPADPLRNSADATGWARDDAFGPTGPMTTWCQEPSGSFGCMARAIKTGGGWREIEGDRWEAAEFPHDGWGGALEVQGAAWTLLLVRFAGGVETDRFDLGQRLSLTIEITDIDVQVDGELGRLRAPKTVADEACRQLDLLYTTAQNELRDGRVQRCHYGRYTGDASLVCRPVALPAAEAAAWQANLHNEEDRHCQQVRDDSNEIAALVATLWPE